jgi:hypothetical protein
MPLTKPKPPDARRKPGRPRKLRYRTVGYSHLEVAYLYKEARRLTRRELGNSRKRPGEREGLLVRLEQKHLARLLKQRFPRFAQMETDELLAEATAFWFQISTLFEEASGLTPTKIGEEKGAQLKKLETTVNLQTLKSLRGRASKLQAEAFEDAFKKRNQLGSVRWASDPVSLPPKLVNLNRLREHLGVDAPRTQRRRRAKLRK